MHAAVLMFFQKTVITENKIDLDVVVSFVFEEQMKGFIKPFEPGIAHFILSAMKWVIKLLTVNKNTIYM